MRKLALPEEILMSVDKPARYIGNEWNSVMKDPSAVDVRFAMCFPDVYEIGMSHLGIQILYEMYNRRPDIYCERVYSPWPDLHAVMKEKQIPLFTIETQSPVRDMDFLGITLQYEMCYTNVLQVLDLSGIPLSASERTDRDPIVVAGGPCTYNAEPVAEFFDMFFIGEGEVTNLDVMDLYIAMKKDGSYTREGFLRRAAAIPGTYVPSMYEVSYNEDGTIRSIEPKYPDIPRTVRRQVLADFDSGVYPRKPIVPFIKATQDRVVLEIMRGCIRGCRFCQAGDVYRPDRQKSLETLISLADDMLSSTGHEEISLSSLSSSDYRQLPELLDYLLERCAKDRINISLPSLRIDAFSLDVMSKVQDVRKSSLTFAPEAGSQRMRNVINKGLTKEDILHGAKEAFEGGWQKVKLYFMLGLPLETEEDMREIPRLANEICDVYFEIPKEQRNGKCQVNISTSFFVPKPFTPFQWAPMLPPEAYTEKAKVVKDEMHRQSHSKCLHYQWHHPDVTVLEGVLARGDRRVSKAIRHVYEHGGIFDAWTEFFSMERWMNAFEECGISIPFYAYRERSLDEVLPWDVIDTGITKAFLKREWERAKEGVITPNCAMGCAGCGCGVFEAGICPTAKK